MRKPQIFHSFCMSVKIGLSHKVNINWGCLRIDWRREGGTKCKWQEEGENCMTRGLIRVIVTLSWKYNGGDEIEEDEIGGFCGMHGREDSAHKVWYVNLREWDHLDDLHVDGSTIGKIIKSDINRSSGWPLDVCGWGCRSVAGCCEKGNEPSSSLPLKTVYVLINDVLPARNSALWRQF